MRPGATLVLGEGLAPEALAVAERIAAERDARIVRPEPLARELSLRSRGPFQRRNFAVARAAAEAYLRQARASRSTSRRCARRLRPRTCRGACRSSASSP